MQQGSAIRCSNCGQPFNAHVYSYIDAQKDPQAKGLLVNQQINRFQCPNCGNVNVVLAPLLYHDAVKEMLIACVPMEPELQQGSAGTGHWRLDEAAS